MVNRLEQRLFIKCWLLLFVNQACLTYTQSLDHLYASHPYSQFTDKSIALSTIMTEERPAPRIVSVEALASNSLFLKDVWLQLIMCHSKLTAVMCGGVEGEQECCTPSQESGSFTFGEGGRQPALPASSHQVRSMWPLLGIDFYNWECVIFKAFP